MDADSRLAVLESRVERLERHDAEQDLRLKATEDDNARTRTDFVILRMQVLLFAAIGASIGNQLVNGVLNAIISYIARGSP